MKKNTTVAVSENTKLRLKKINPSNQSYDYTLDQILNFLDYLKHLNVNGFPVFNLFPESEKRRKTELLTNTTTIQVSNYNKRKLDDMFWYLKSNDEAIRTLSDYYDRYFSLKIFNETNPPDLFQNMYHNLIKSDKEFSKHTKTVRITHDTRRIFKNMFFHKGSVDFKLFVLITFYNKNH